jgi:tRNA A37 N6-isopentenylltransferase MiaA
LSGEPSKRYKDQHFSTEAEMNIEKIHRPENPIIIKGGLNGELEKDV